MRRARSWTTEKTAAAVVVVAVVVKLVLDHLVVAVSVLAAAVVVTVMVVGGRARRRWRLRARDTDQLWALDPQRLTPGGFEEYLAALCRRDGCQGVSVVGGAGDLAADVLGTLPGHRWWQVWMPRRRFLIQAKRYADGSKVSSGDVQKVAGTYRAIHRCDLALVVTTAGFTREAQDLAHRVGIILVGRDGLAAWAERGRVPWS